MDYLKTKRMLRLFRNCPPNKPLNQPAAEEMQLIRPTSEFEVGHLPFQGKVKCKTTQPRCARETFL